MSVCTWRKEQWRRWFQYFMGCLHFPLANDSGDVHQASGSSIWRSVRVSCRAVGHLHVGGTCTRERVQGNIQESCLGWGDGSVESWETTTMQKSKKKGGVQMEKTQENLWDMSRQLGVRVTEPAEYRHLRWRLSPWFSAKERLAGTRWIGIDIQLSVKIFLKLLL